MQSKGRWGVAYMKISYRVLGQDLGVEILVAPPPLVPSEAVALLWILQSFEEAGAAVEADWMEGDLAKLRAQVEALGVTDVSWEQG